MMKLLIIIPARYASTRFPVDEVNPGTLLNPILYETSVYNWKRYNSYTYDLMQCAVSTSSTNGVGSVSYTHLIVY